MNKYIILSLIFAQSTIMIGAEKAVKRTSGPEQEAHDQKGIPIPKQPKSSHRLTPEKSPRDGNSPYSPVDYGSNTIYYSNIFCRLGEFDFSPADSKK